MALGFLGSMLPSLVGGLFGNRGTQSAINQANTAYGQLFDSPLYGAAENAALGAFRGLGSFDRNQMTSEYLNTLNQMAQPQENRAVNQTLNRLFSQGRLGSSGGAQAMGQLAQGQNIAANQRQMQASQMAQQQQLAQSQMAGQLFGQAFNPRMQAMQPNMYGIAKAQDRGLFDVLGGAGDILGGMGMSGLFGDFGIPSDWTIPGSQQSQMISQQNAGLFG